jgi:hypothetical protein
MELAVSRKTPDHIIGSATSNMNATPHGNKATARRQGFPQEGSSKRVIPEPIEPHATPAKLQKSFQSIDLW